MMESYMDFGFSDPDPFSFEEEMTDAPAEESENRVEVRLEDLFTTDEGPVPKRSCLGLISKFNDLSPVKTFFLLTESEMLTCRIMEKIAAIWDPLAKLEVVQKRNVSRRDLGNKKTIQGLRRLILRTRIRLGVKALGYDHCNVMIDNSRVEDRARKIRFPSELKQDYDTNEEWKRDFRKDIFLLLMILRDKIEQKTLQGCSLVLDVYDDVDFKVYK